MVKDEERVVYGSFHIVHLEFWKILRKVLQNISLAESARTAISTLYCYVPWMPTDWNGTLSHHGRFF